MLHARLPRHFPTRGLRQGRDIEDRPKRFQLCLVQRCKTDQAALSARAKMNFHAAMVVRALPALYQSGFLAAGNQRDNTI
ncbi:hypothetical protein RM96_08410 [Cupriavidus sp. IDO]|nr:hypothetical protein RM96_08410 [Cupriavidus sp. IDO]